MGEDGGVSGLGETVEFGVKGEVYEVSEVDDLGDACAVCSVGEAGDVGDTGEFSVVCGCEEVGQIGGIHTVGRG